MIRYLQLPFHFDTHRMQEEVAAVTALWKLHFNQRDYQGNWSGIALRSPGGAMDNLFAEAFDKDVPFLDTPLLADCPYLREVIAALDCTKTSIRLLKLSQEAVVREHTDAGLNFEQGEVRLHLPIVTHPMVDFYLDGDRLEMKAGDCWYINASLPHRLANPSSVDRVHLVIDCMVNDWVKDLFERDDLPVKSVKDMSAQQALQRLEIIAALRASNDPVRIRLADQMEAGTH